MDLDLWILLTHSSNPIGLMPIDRNSHAIITALLVHCATVSSALHRDRCYHRIIGDAAAIPKIDAARDWLRSMTRGMRARKDLGKKGEENEGKRDSGEGGRETDRRKGTTTEREREKEKHARLSADAADSTTGGGGLTAPLHIHPRYIDLSRPPPLSRLTTLLTTLLSGTRAHQERSVESVPGAAAAPVSAIRRGWGTRRWWWCWQWRR